MRQNNEAHKVVPLKQKKYWSPSANKIIKFL